VVGVRLLEVIPASRITALRALGAQAEGAREVLRVYDVTFITFTGDNAWLSFDVELAPGADCWYSTWAASGVVLRRARAAHRRRALPPARALERRHDAAFLAVSDTTVHWVDLAPGAPREGPADGAASAWSGRRRDPTAGEAAPIGEGPRSSDVHAPPAR